MKNVTFPTVIDTQGAAKAAAIDDPQTLACLRGLQWFQVGAGWSVDDVRQVMQAHLKDDRVDEIAIKGDDGKLYMVYGREITKDVAVGKRFESAEVKGEIIAVDAEIARLRGKIDRKDWFVSAYDLALAGLGLFGAVPTNGLTLLATGGGLLQFSEVEDAKKALRQQLGAGDGPFNPDMSRVLTLRDAKPSQNSGTGMPSDDKIDAAIQRFKKYV
jgi:hypothetical protein